MLDPVIFHFLKLSFYPGTLSISATPQLAADISQPQHGPGWRRLVRDEDIPEHVEGRQGKCQDIRDSQNKINQQNIATYVAFDLDQELSKLKSVLADFEKACKQYENAIINDDTLDKCDDYFRKVQDNFIGAVADVRSVKQGADSKYDDASSGSGMWYWKNLISAINLLNQLAIQWCYCLEQFII